MAYRGTLSEKQHLQAALQRVRDSGQSMEHLASVMSKEGAHVSRSHLNAILLADPDFAGKKWNYDQLASVFRFFEISPLYKDFMLAQGHDSERSDSYFFSAGYRYFEAPFNRDYGSLISLVGTYAMVRPIWSSEIEDHFVRSIVTIEKSGDSFILQEHQSYKDPHGVQVNETSTGYLFSFGSVLFSVTNEKDHQCRRFVCIHNFSTAPSMREASIDRFDGEIKSISTHNIGPPAAKFRCRRVEDKKFDCSVIKGLCLIEEDRIYFGRDTRKKRRKAP